MPSIKKTTRRYKSRFFSLVKHPFFWVLTLFGNSVIFIGAILLFIFESKSPMQFVDFLLWSTGIVTTIGYGNTVAETLGGKLTIFFLMLIGTLFVWSYMAFIVAGLIAPELASFEKDVYEFEKEIKNIKKIKS